MKVYGISNCDTVRKSRKWLDQAGISHEFHDFRKQGLSEQQLSHWEEAVGWEALLNRRGTAWRKLPEPTRDSIDAASAHALMLDNPTLIKRPVVEAGDAVTVGFSPERWQALT